MSSPPPANQHNVSRGPGSFAGRKVLVVGLGRFGGGVGVTRWLCGQGAAVLITDQAAADTLADSLDAIRDLPVRTRLGGHSIGDLDRIDLVVLNPAVDKRRSELFEAVVARNLPWTTEINLFCERCPADVVAVTGAYGKSTTCAMIAAVLDAGREAHGNPVGKVSLGGNIGGSLLAELPDLTPSDVVVLELSSAQLEDLPRIAWSPRVAVITNLHPHHLDRYGDFDKYAAAKFNVLGNNVPPHALIAGEMHPDAERILTDRLRGTAIRLVRARAGTNLPLRVPGDHNQRNAACALAACESLGCDGTAARAALEAFPGLPHRLEWVLTLDGVDYYNDSKSTSPTATMRSIEALVPPVVAIVGGQTREVALAEFGRTLARSCAAVICTGESGPAFATAIRAAGDAHGAVRVIEAPSLAEAIARARAAAAPGTRVLFSPGAPSFDAYGNFAERGRRFVEALQALR